MVSPHLHHQLGEPCECAGRGRIAWEPYSKAQSPTSLGGGLRDRDIPHHHHQRSEPCKSPLLSWCWEFVGPPAADKHPQLCCRARPGIPGAPEGSEPRDYVYAGRTETRPRPSAFGVGAQPSALDPERATRVPPEPGASWHWPRRRTFSEKLGAEARFPGASTHLRGHHALSLGNQVALLALAVPPHAEALVALERRRVAVIPAARTLGQPWGLLVRGAHASRPGAAAAAPGARAAGRPKQCSGRLAEASSLALRRCPRGVRSLRRRRGLAEGVVVGHGVPGRSTRLSGRLSRLGTAAKEAPNRRRGSRGGGGGGVCAAAGGAARVAR